mmetsp:Transcript_6120/g.11968  ORF Transcript_6120/g.11968 Transcript_6120/m.11968 type:complete len:308 (+) Transcript_6120:1457-2380(+)
MLREVPTHTPLGSSQWDSQWISTFLRVTDEDDIERGSTKITLAEAQPLGACLEYPLIIRELNRPEASFVLERRPVHNVDFLKNAPAFSHCPMDEPVEQIMAQILLKTKGEVVPVSASPAPKPQSGLVRLDYGPVSCMADAKPIMENVQRISFSEKSPYLVAKIRRQVDNQGIRKMLEQRIAGLRSCFFLLQNLPANPLCLVPRIASFDLGDNENTRAQRKIPKYIGLKAFVGQGRLAEDVSSLLESSRSTLVSGLHCDEGGTDYRPSSLDLGFQYEVIETRAPFEVPPVIYPLGALNINVSWPEATR